MKNTTTSKVLATLSAAALLLLTNSSTQAGPGPREMYHPVTVKQAQQLPVGEQIAVSCGNCGGITTITVDKDRSYLRGFTCPMCKRQFHQVQPGGGGRAAAIGQFTYADDAGHFAQLAAKH